MAQQGRVAALVGAGAVEIKSFDVPEPDPGAVVVRVRRANICGSEVHIFHFHHPLIRECVLGHEFVGEIVALGDGVTTDYAGDPVQVGDRVTAPYFLTCRRCRACLRGDFPLCAHAYDFWSQPAERAPHFTGAFATHYYIQPDQYFFRVPDDVPDTVVAGANCGLTQVLYGLEGLRPGDRLVIQGAGGLGLYAAAIARDAGAHVTVVERIPERIELARAFGADAIIDMNEHETVQARADAAGEPDVVLEVTGVAAAFAEALALVRAGGTVIEIGNVNVGERHAVALSPGLITRKSLTVRGVVRYPPWYLHRALRFLQRAHRRHPFDALSDREYALDEVAAAIGREEAREVARPADRAGLAEGAGVARAAQALGVVAAQLGEQGVGVLAARRTRVVRGAEPQRRRHDAHGPEPRVLVGLDGAARLRLRILERLEHVVDAPARDARGAQPPHRLVGRQPRHPDPAVGAGERLERHDRRVRGLGAALGDVALGRRPRAEVGEHGPAPNCSTASTRTSSSGRFTSPWRTLRRPVRQPQHHPRVHAARGEDAGMAVAQPRDDRRAAVVQHALAVDDAPA